MDTGRSGTGSTNTGSTATGMAATGDKAKSGTLVMKFGGSLTSNKQHLVRLAQVVAAEALARARLVVVVSAMARTTDTLNEALRHAVAGEGPPYRQAIARLRKAHVDLISSLFNETSASSAALLMDELDRRLFDVLAILDRACAAQEATPRDRDKVLAVGERVMVEIVAALTRHEGMHTAVVDAENLIVTNGTHQNAQPIMDATQEQVERLLIPVLDSGAVALVAGFIGASQSGHTTTLGRGGSDYSATLLGAALKADEVWMWTHVDGIMSADPALVPGARVIDELSYDEVAELSYFGARVLHPDAIAPLASHRIPLRVRNPNNLENAGTIIQPESEHAGLKAVTAVDGICMTQTRASMDIGDLLVQVHRVVGGAAAGPVITMQGYQRATVVFVVPTSEGPAAAEDIRCKLRSALTRWDVQVVKVVAALGTFTTLPDIVPLAYAMGADGRRLFAVAPEDVQATVRQLHKFAEASAHTVSGPKHEERPERRS